MHQLPDLLALLVLVVPRKRSRISLAPNPAELNRLVRLADVDEHRNFSCSEYAVCLEAALRRGWPSWTCNRCALFPARRGDRAAEVAYLTTAP